MSFTGVMRPGHAAIRVMDMDESVTYYTERMGLMKTDEDNQGRVYLKGWEELDCFSIVLREADSAGHRLYRLQDVFEERTRMNLVGKVGRLRSGH